MKMWMFLWTKRSSVVFEGPSVGFEVSMGVWVFISGMAGPLSHAVP